MARQSLPKQNKKNRSDSKKKAPLHPLEALLGETVLDAHGETVSPSTFAVEEGEDGVIGVYFSAHWCPPCKLFTPRLAVFYDEVKSAERKFEVVFVSFDYNVKSFKDYFSKMPWYAVNFSDSDKRDAIAAEFGIKGIPVLIFLDAATCKPITLNGRDVVMLDPRGDKFPWKTPMENLSDTHSERTVQEASREDSAGTTLQVSGAKKDSAATTRQVSGAKKDSAGAIQVSGAKKDSAGDIQVSVAKKDSASAMQVSGAKKESAGAAEKPEDRHTLQDQPSKSKLGERKQSVMLTPKQSTTGKSPKH